jgi:hypothetical protein
MFHASVVLGSIIRLKDELLAEKKSARTWKGDVIGVSEEDCRQGQEVAFRRCLPA